MVSTLWFWGWFLVSGTSFFWPQCFQNNYSRVQESHIRSLFWSKKWIARIIFGMFFYKIQSFSQTPSRTPISCDLAIEEVSKKHDIYFCFFNTRTHLLKLWNDSFQKVKDRSQKTSCGNHLVKSARVSCRGVSTPWPGSFMAQHSSCPQGILATLCLNYKIWNATQIT